MKIFEPAKFTEEQAAAIRALAKGNASPGQQRDALLWIVDEACGNWGDGFSPGKPDVTTYMNGRRSVALQITAVLRSRPSKKETK